MVQLRSRDAGVELAVTWAVLDNVLMTITHPDGETLILSEPIRTKPLSAR